MSADFVLMEQCSIRFTFFLYCVVKRIVMVLLLQTFISELMPLLTHTSLDPMSPPLSFPVLHSILEDFSTPYYHSIQLHCTHSCCKYFTHLSSVTQKPYKLFADISFFKGVEYKFDNSKVPLFVNSTRSNIY